MNSLRWSLEVEAKEYIEKAAKHDIPLELDDFTIIDGEITLDGMDPGDWLDAMTMD